MGQPESFHDSPTLHRGNMNNNNNHHHSTDNHDTYGSIETRPLVHRMALAANEYTIPIVDNSDDDLENNTKSDDDSDSYRCCGGCGCSIRTLALQLSLYVNIAITIAKLVTYVHSWSLSVLAALLDSVLDVVSQLVLNYTEQHSTLQRSSAVYPAGARYVAIICIVFVDLVLSCV
jgi:hypothetical protein